VWPICLKIDLFHFIVLTADRAKSVYMLLITQPLLKCIKEFISIIINNGIYVQPIYWTKCNWTKLETTLSAFEKPWLKPIDLLPTSRIYSSEKVILTHKVHHEVSTVKLSVLTYNWRRIRNVHKLLLIKTFYPASYLIEEKTNYLICTQWPIERFIQ